MNLKYTVVAACQEYLGQRLDALLTKDIGRAANIALDEWCEKHRVHCTGWCLKALPNPGDTIALVAKGPGGETVALDDLEAHLRTAKKKEQVSFEKNCDGCPHDKDCNPAASLPDRMSDVLEGFDRVIPSGEVRGRIEDLAKQVLLSWAKGQGLDPRRFEDWKIEAKDCQDPETGNTTWFVRLHAAPGEPFAGSSLCAADAERVILAQDLASKARDQERCAQDASRAVKEAAEELAQELAAGAERFRKLSQEL